MAEGGDLDPTELNPVDPNNRDDGESMGMVQRTSTHIETPYGRPRDRDDEGQTSFVGTDETTPLLQGVMDEIMSDRDKDSNEAFRRIKERYPTFDKETSPFRATLDPNDRILVTLKQRHRGTSFFKGKPHLLFDKYGNLNDKLPKTIKEALGPIAEDVIATNEVSISQHDNKAFELESKSENTVEGSQERKRLVEQAEGERQSASTLRQDNAEIRDRMTLKERVKEIFKKYGLTVVGVSVAVATVIGVIVSSLKSGLAKVGKGVGDGLKALGKKLGQILPGMIGAIASFLFKTAGEAIGFLAKNAWLLIVAVVVYFVEQAKR